MTKRHSRITCRIAAVVAALSPFIISGCGPVSYLEGRLPDDLIFRKKSSGALIQIAGGELLTSEFCLYADGTVIKLAYIDNRRQLARYRVGRKAFMDIYQELQSRWISASDTAGLLSNSNKNDIQSADIYTQYFFGTETVTVRPLQAIKNQIPNHGLPALHLWLDTLSLGHPSPFLSDSVLLFVKKIEKADASMYPVWPFKSIDLSVVYKRQVSIYEPNVSENSVKLTGVTARRIQKIIPAQGQYVKYQINKTVFAVGYRPILPKE